MPAISVVMPVYNTEKYVAKAIESVLGQTFSDFEFIIIDNGSSDGSSRIIYEYAQKDTRIRIIFNRENVFIADARNQAMKELAGEYMYLIDSDDWILPTMLETMYKRAKAFSAQYVVCGYYMDYFEGGKELSYVVAPEDADYTQEEFRKHAVDYLVHTILTVPWNKLYSISYIREHDIKFRHTKLEDHHFNMDFIMDVERVSLIAEPFYHYYRSRQGTDSQLVYNYFLNQKKRDHMEHTLEVYKHWNISDRETMGKLADYHMGRLVQCVVNTANNQDLNRDEKYSEIESIISDRLTNFAIHNCSNQSWKIRVLSIPIRIHSKWLCMAMGKFVVLFQTRFPAVFSSLRAKEAQGARSA